MIIINNRTMPEMSLSKLIVGGMNIPLDVLKKSYSKPYDKFITTTFKIDMPKESSIKLMHHYYEVDQFDLFIPEYNLYSIGTITKMEPCLEIIGKLQFT